MAGLPDEAAAVRSSPGKAARWFGLGALTRVASGAALATGTLITSAAGAATRWAALRGRCFQAALTTLARSLVGLDQLEEVSALPEGAELQGPDMFSGNEEARGPAAVAGGNWRLRAADGAPPGA